MSNLDARLDGDLSQEGDPLKAVLFYHFIYTVTGYRERHSVKSCIQPHTFSNHRHTPCTCLSCSWNSLRPQSWPCPTARWGSASPTRCPSPRRLDSRGCGGVGSCGERAAHLSRSRGGRTRSSRGSSGSDWRQQRKLQAPHPERKWRLET